MVSEMLQPIKKAAALTRALVVASNKMNTTMVLGDTLASRPSSAMVITRPMGLPVSGPVQHYRVGCCYERYRLIGPLRWLGDRQSRAPTKDAASSPGATGGAGAAGT